MGLHPLKFVFFFEAISETAVGYQASYRGCLDGRLTSLALQRKMGPNAFLQVQKAWGLRD